MIEIINENVNTVKCWNCLTSLKYDSMDVQEEVLFLEKNKFIICPKCEKRVYVHRIEYTYQWS